MILVPALILTALTILAGLGAWYIVSYAFSPWHFLVGLIVVLAVLLIFHLAWVLIGRLGK